MGRKITFDWVGNCALSLWWGVSYSNTCFLSPQVRIFCLAASVTDCHQKKNKFGSVCRNVPHMQEIMTSAHSRGETHTTLEALGFRQWSPSPCHVPLWEKCREELANTPESSSQGRDLWTSGHSKLWKFLIFSVLCWLAIAITILLPSRSIFTLASLHTSSSYPLLLCPVPLTLFPSLYFPFN